MVGSVFVLATPKIAPPMTFCPSVPELPEVPLLAPPNGHGFTTWKNVHGSTCLARARLQGLPKSAASGALKGHRLNCALKAVYFVVPSGLQFARNFLPHAMRPH